MQPQAAPATAPVSRSSVEPSPTPAIPSEHHPPTAPKAAEQGATPQTTSQEGLETFDFTTFDYTSPAAWELLGKAWAVSYGYLPSQEELMQLVVARSMTDVGAASTSQGTMQGDQWSANGWMGSYGGIGNEEMWNGDGQGDWTAGGMGVSYYGNGRDGQEQWGFGGSPSEVSEAPMVASNPAVSAPAELLDKSEAMLEEQSGGGGNSVGASGRMQKVGDKWIFVKGAA
ncbi:hypothetical protein JAAARDRAFT_122738 [Jaapia argillacea MUCL 33604]|uniref:Uncharacterized protein n=1 Tax=Jaapia argillacea MUCL 33604 TaxID=933084 RepID=A0A067QDG8_9AGAM|nr:hypothetical protein JAAARDRAFT_122738 [Jaapia argillacea MUCL 33604]